MGGNTIQKAVWFSFVVFTGALLLNAAVQDIEMWKSPGKRKILMVGNELDLQWKYNIRGSARNQWIISLYVYTNNAKNTLLTLQRGKPVSRGKNRLPKYPRLNQLELTYNSARIFIPNTEFVDTASYGVAFQPNTQTNASKRFEKVTDVKIVDMYLDKEKTSTVEYTWIGQPVKLVCAIIIKVGRDSPSFSWKNVLKNITFTENILVARKYSKLTITPDNDDDFGSYKCYARTFYTTIKHNMTLLKVDYPGYPIFLKFSPGERTLTWKAPKKNEHERSSFFKVQYLQDRFIGGRGLTYNWIDVNITSDLCISIDSLSRYLTVNSASISSINCSVRVCLKNGVSRNATCSREHKIYSSISEAPIIRLENNSKKAILSWKRQDSDTAEILGYIIQIFNSSRYKPPKLTSSIHLDEKGKKGDYTFKNLKMIKHALLRVCVRNTLCIYEISCSKKVGLPPVNPSKPRSIKIEFYTNELNISQVKISWEEPRVIGKGSVFYIVEVRNGEKGEWKKMMTTEQFENLTEPSLTEHVRVCAANYVDRKRSACSKIYDLGKEKLKNLEIGSGGWRCAGTETLIIVVLMILYALCH